MNTHQRFRAESIYTQTIVLHLDNTPLWSLSMLLHIILYCSNLQPAQLVILVIITINVRDFIMNNYHVVSFNTWPAFTITFYLSFRLYFSPKGELHIYHEESSYFPNFPNRNPFSIPSTSFSPTMFCSYCVSYSPTLTNTPYVLYYSPVLESSNHWVLESSNPRILNYNSHVKYVHVSYVYLLHHTCIVYHVPRILLVSHIKCTYSMHGIYGIPRSWILDLESSVLNS